MKCLLRVTGMRFAWLILIACLASNSFSQDAAQLDDTTEQAQDQQSEEPQEEEESEEDDANRFIPSEQVSQDLGVSFPSDI